MFGLSPLMASPTISINTATRAEWESSTVFPPIQLEASNTRLVLPSGNSGVGKTARSTLSLFGKKYFEFIILDVLDGYGTTTGIGIADSAQPWDSQNLSTGGANAKNVGLWPSGRIYRASSYSENPTLVYKDGDIIMVAADRVNGRVYFGKNGAWPSGVNPGGNAGWQSPLNTGGTMYVACSPWSSVSRTVKVEIAIGAGLTYPIPVGFSSL